jgi:hypothetical protein
MQPCGCSFLAGLCSWAEETAADTLAWVRKRPAAPLRPEGCPLPPPAGLSPEREADLLARLSG